MKKSLYLFGILTLLAGCSTLDAINPFSSSGPKMTELQAIKATATTRIVWRDSVGKAGLYAFTPAIVGASVYVADKDGTLARFDDGKQTWKIKTEQPLSAGVGADLTKVAVGSPKGDLLVFSAADGKLLWKAKATSEILAPPAIGEGLVIVRSGDNRLAAYGAEDGKRKWIFQRPMPALSLRVTTAPLIDNKHVLAGFPNGKLIAVNAANGAADWDGTVAVPKGATELDRVADITSAPALAGRLICAVAFQGRVACFDLANGAIAWAREMSSSVGLTVDQRNLYVTDDKGTVHALDLASGASLWKQDKLYLRRVSAPVVSRNFVVVADAQGVLHFLNREDGAFAARQSTDGSPVVAPLQLQGSRVIAQTSSGGIFAVEAE